MKKHKYRVLQTGDYTFYPQIKYWYFPFCWFNLGSSTGEDYSDAMGTINYYRFQNEKLKFKPKVVHEE